MTSHPFRSVRAALVLAGVIAPFALGAQTAVKSTLGGTYGSREPHACASTKAPGKGPPPTDVVREALLCSKEGERVLGPGHALYLLEDLKFDIDPKGQAYDAKASLPDVDRSVPVYALRGSYATYICDPSSAARGNVGSNCAIYTVPSAAGVCFKTLAGDWQCGLNGAFGQPQQKKAPPRASQRGR
ncbi:MAG TPA: hypothetical protein VE967_17215 [Gemmatimonadaceae bacterium]|nr:hypothetical protein [Gemmatimonadaceae bacterium]